MFDLKTRHNVSQAAFTDFLAIAATVARPEVRCDLPHSYQQAHAQLAPLLSEVVRYDVCKQECQLFELPRAMGDCCSTCGSPRLDGNGRPWLTYRRIPLEPRLRRLFQTPVQSLLLNIF